MTSSISKQASRAMALVLGFVIFAPTIEYLGASMSAGTLWE